MASPRASCISPSRPFTSLAMRLALVTYWNEGMAMPARVPIITTVVRSSMSVTPDSLLETSPEQPLCGDGLLASVWFMGGNVRVASLREADDEPLQPAQGSRIVQ